MEKWPPAESLVCHRNRVTKRPWGQKLFVLLVSRALFFKLELILLVIVTNEEISLAFGNFLAGSVFHRCLRAEKLVFNSPQNLLSPSALLTLKSDILPPYLSKRPGRADDNQSFSQSFFLGDILTFLRNHRDKDYEKERSDKTKHTVDRHKNRLYEVTSGLILFLPLSSHFPPWFLSFHQLLLSWYITIHPYFLPPLSPCTLSLPWYR